MQGKLLTVEGLTVEYWTRKGRVRAVDDVSFTLDRAETLGVVGESGSGKSTLGLSLIRLTPPPGRIVRGHIWLDGEGLLKLKEEEMRNVRGRKIAFVFQDPMTSLNPVKKIGEHFVELIKTHEPRISSKRALERAEELLKNVGIQPERINDYPHQ
ncbi:MAG: ATP-binding cassette domain-containing protein, partial [Thermoproteota archaeon]